MIISGLQKLSLLDFPGYTACIIFTQGCNYKCAYCQNSKLITNDKNNIIDEDELLDFLDKRKNMLEGIVISGGEPTVQKDLEDFIVKVKSLGYKVKLDTNGSNPIVLEKLLNKKLLDYVAMDIKTTWDCYQDITVVKANTNNLKKSVEIIKNSHIDHEFRMTINQNQHDINKIIEVCNYVGKNENFYLQNFEYSENVLDKTLKSFSKAELINIKKIIEVINPNVKIRGL